MKWKSINKKPKKTDYVFITDGSFVSLGIYDKETDTFFNLFNHNGMYTETMWWMSCPLPPTDKKKFFFNQKGRWLL